MYIISSRTRSRNIFLLVFIPVLFALLFTAIPESSLAKAKSPKLKVDKISGSSARVSFAKVAGSSQYQIRYRVKGKKWVRKDVKSSKKRVSVKISRLRSGKKYQVSARVLTNGKPGKWSAAKTFATKKVWGKISEKSIVIRRNAKNTAFTITFKPVKKAKSYSVRYRLNANGQKWKTKTVKKGKGKKQKITLKKLKPGKKYCLQLRALKGKKKGPWTRKIYANTFSGGSNSTEAAKASAKVKKYSYEVRPLIAPFNGTVFVKTDNPDPDSFAFIDKKSKYIEKPEALVRNAILSLNTGEYEDEGTGIFSRLTRRYIDVAYENVAKRRVKGGYLFSTTGDTDGGDLSLIALYGDTGYTDTGKKVKCPSMKTSSDYLLDTYTTSGMSFFEKLDAVQAALNEISVYPRSVVDTSVLNTERNYPQIVRSYYIENGFSWRYHPYGHGDGYVLLRSAYPFIRDSASMPGNMSYIASKLDPSCKVEWLEYEHAYIAVTLNGESRTYGGAGIGRPGSLYTKYVDKTFTFAGGSSDFGSNNDLKGWQNKLMSYNELSANDTSETKPIEDARAKFESQIGPGSWALVSVEGWLGYGTSFTYYICKQHDDDSPSVLYNAWVDGRHIGEWCLLSNKTTFAEHPNDSIVRRNVTYKNKEGTTKTGDLLFVYDETRDRWEALEAYYNTYSWYVDDISDLPKEFIITRAEAEKMNLDAKAGIEPEHGLKYDGNVPPGTKF